MSPTQQLHMYSMSGKADIIHCTPPVTVMLLHVSHTASTNVHSVMYADACHTPPVTVMMLAPV